VLKDKHLLPANLNQERLYQVKTRTIKNRTANGKGSDSTKQSINYCFSISDTVLNAGPQGLPSNNLAPEVF